MAKTFEEIYAINVNDYVERKGNLNYLSWAYAWREFKKIFPDAQYEVDRFDGTYCTGNETVGWMVHTKVTAEAFIDKEDGYTRDITYEMWLPVMDGKNKTILQPVMTEINKTIMRCLTKNLAMFGLGLYIYAGEDYPDTGEEDETPQDKTPRELLIAKLREKEIDVDEYAKEKGLSKDATPERFAELLEELGD